MKGKAAARLLVRAIELRSGLTPSSSSRHFSSGSRSFFLDKLARPVPHQISRCGSSRFSSSAAAHVVNSQNSPTDHENHKNDDQQFSNYWGIITKKTLREDGTPWPWNCFKPSDSYVSDTSIDVKKHHIPDAVVDKVALKTVKFLRALSDLFFQERHGCHAVLLETVAAVPGMVGGMLLHCKSLRKFEHSGGWIKALLEEAENERMHLMTFMEVFQPKWYERALVLAVQGVFFNGYFALYLIFPRLAHRFVGYLEEEAVASYTEFLAALDKGSMPNTPAPAIAIDYWRLPSDATLRDVVFVVRADEAHHRDVNHFAADAHLQGKELKDSPAPIGYH
ncbi:hypothetical protein SELMODRAFT_421378 [Selaginella moellendorffii]|uniref:Ubiquinol oxidase n=1 Tax=Selaginella moellendorffii TaxID=88036 RepID=D8SF31_SELML|nr:ubiquinol oxidase 2, mitochondrial [Selaginella moellendorffii]EFJ17087.1 hypothetical protein SELMODRAFT_421378 [Selaginella moellendorffii]|eukprot:XP_002981994.1 ubiquinol oxidase 2, mitochondrial [Selaginella moellendorffii]